MELKLGDHLHRTSLTTFFPSSVHDAVDFSTVSPATMASTARATRALLFMQHCRQTSRRKPVLTFTRDQSDVSHLHPSNFSKPIPNSNAAFHLKPNISASSSFASTFPKPAWEYPAAKSINVPEPAVNISAWGRVKMLFGWQPPKPRLAPARFTALNNPYRARKKWPPEFSTLHPKQQFHYEKTYRRRAKLKWARPNWHRWTKLVQHTLITFTFIYFIFICEPSHGQGTPFDGFRVWFYGKLKNLGRMPDPLRDEMEKLEQDARTTLEKRANMYTRVSSSSSSTS